MARRGLVLSSIMRLKQICNHPSQWLDDGAYVEDDSGKFARLFEIAETVACRQEKLLAFTQFKEIIPAIEKLLGLAFGSSGLVLHGETAVAKRKDLVKKFQEDERVPFFVLSIKAGGAGLISPPPRMSFTSTAGGTRRSRIRRQTAPFVSGRSAMSSCINSSAVARSKSESTS